MEYFLLSNKFALFTDDALNTNRYEGIIFILNPILLLILMFINLNICTIIVFNSIFFRIRIHRLVFMLLELGNAMAYWTKKFPITGKCLKPKKVIIKNVR